MNYTLKRAPVDTAPPCFVDLRCVNSRAVEAGFVPVVTKEITETFQKILKHQ